MRHSDKVKRYYKAVNALPEAKGDAAAYHEGVLCTLKWILNLKDQLPISIEADAKVTPIEAAKKKKPAKKKKVTTPQPEPPAAARLKHA